MQIKLESVSIIDLDHALKFYTEVLGFVKKRDIPMGETRFVTVVSPEDPDGTELVLEPNGEHQATKVYKEALYKEGIPFTAFRVEDIISEHAKLKESGVNFRSDPQQFGSEIVATFDDTCGNLIMIYQEGVS